MKIDLGLGSIDAWKFKLSSENIIINSNRNSIPHIVNFSILNYIMRNKKVEIDILRLFQLF